MNIIHLLKKPFVNEVTLIEQNLSKKCWLSLCQRLCQQMRFKPFKRGMVRVCMSKGCKITSRQSWTNEKKSESNQPGPGLSTSLGQFYQPQWYTEIHSTSFERSKPSLLTWSLIKRLTEFLGSVLIWQGDSICVGLVRWLIFI